MTHQHTETESQQPLSIPGIRFLQAQHELVNLIAFVGELAIRVDETRLIAAEALLESVDEGDDEYARLREVIDAPEVARKTLQNYRRLLLEVLASRSVDNFLTYVSEAITIVFKARPETHRTKEQVAIEFVLRYPTQEEFVQALADLKVERLAFRSIIEVDEHLRDQLGLSLFNDDKSREIGVMWNSLRNLIVHNRGRISERFYKNVTTELGETGEPVNLDTDFVFTGMDQLKDIAVDFDLRASSKFDLEVHEFTPSPMQDNG